MKKETISEPQTKTRNYLSDLHLSTVTLVKRLFVGVVALDYQQPRVPQLPQI